MWSCTAAGVSGAGGEFKTRTAVMEGLLKTRFLSVRCTRVRVGSNLNQSIPFRDN